MAQDIRVEAGHRIHAASLVLPALGYRRVTEASLDSRERKLDTSSLFYFILFYLFLAALGLRCCMRAFSSREEQGLLFVVVCRLLIAVASLVSEHGL